MALIKKSQAKGPGENFPITDEHRTKAKNDTYRLRLFGGDVEKAAQSIAAGMNFVNIGEGANKRLVLMNPKASFTKSYNTSTGNETASGSVAFLPNSSGTAFEMVNVDRDFKTIRPFVGGQDMQSKSLTGDNVLNYMSNFLTTKSQEIETAVARGGRIKTSDGVINVPTPDKEGEPKGTSPKNTKAPTMKKK
jgi:hypothetical protein